MPEQPAPLPEPIVTTARGNRVVLVAIVIIVVVSAVMGIRIGRASQTNKMALVNLTGRAISYETRLPNGKLLSGKLGHEGGTLLTIPGTMSGALAITVQDQDGHTTHVQAGAFVPGLPIRGEVRITSQGVTQDWDQAAKPRESIAD